MCKVLPSRLPLEHFFRLEAQELITHCKESAERVSIQLRCLAAWPALYRQAVFVCDAFRYLSACDCVIGSMKERAGLSTLQCTQVEGCSIVHMQGRGGVAACTRAELHRQKHTCTRTRTQLQSKGLQETSESNNGADNKTGFVMHRSRCPR